MKNILGAHVSIAGGIDQSFIEAEKIGCSAMQIFTKNSNQWSARKLTVEEIEKFKQEQARTKIKTAAHDSYLINLCSTNDNIRKLSIIALIKELKRCDLLNIPYLIMHPGSHLGAGEKIGIKKIVEGLNRILESKSPAPPSLKRNGKWKVKILLETTAGQGTNLGYKFEQLAEIRKLIKNKKRIGVCLDTCHIFAAGYDLRTRKVYNKTIAEFDKVIGLKNLFIIHINDSKKELGSRVDRHEHINKGYLGKDAFKFLLNDKRLLSIPKILETPKGDMAKDEREWDLEVLNRLEIER